RNFPSRNGYYITVEAKFDGEILTTDPVEHATVPDVNQELAWELDKKTFQHHKLQRSVIKCNTWVNGPGISNENKENIGYFIIDVRPVNNSQKIRWYHLLQTKYPKSKPEFRICVYVEDDRQTKSSTSSSKIAKASISGTGASSSLSSKAKLQPVLLEDQGYYLLGPESPQAEIFSLAITIRVAKNLIHLVPAQYNLSTTDGFFFYYTLFGNDITSETFYDLLNPKFYPERASVRIRTTQQILRSYLESHEPLEFSFWSANDLLGKAVIPLHRIVQSLQTKKAAFDILNEEFTLKLQSPTLKPKEKQQQEEDQERDETTRPIVVVEVKLTRENALENGDDSKTITIATATGTVSEGQKRPPQNEQTNLTSITHDQTKTSNSAHHSSKKQNYQPPIREHAQLLSVNNHALQSSANDGFHNDGDVININDSRQSPSQILTSPLTTISTDTISHHFCLSIDLKSIRNVKTTHPLYLYCKYQYPFLGTSEPILTHPPILFERYQQDLQLPHSFCTFDFACMWQQLIENFKHDPIQVDVCVRDKGESTRTNKDYLFGQVKLQLYRLLQQEKQRCSNSNGIIGWRQTYSQVLSIINSTNEKCGELLVTISLEDLGPLHLNTIAQQNRSQSVPPLPQQNIDLDNVFQHPTDNAQVQVAYELQLWKETRELEFEKHLREIEAKKVYELMEAFKEKDRGRESLLQKKMKEYSELEKQMKKAVSEVERREKLLANNEQEIQRLQIDLKRDYDLKHIEMREASKRLQEQSDHQITLEKNKASALEDDIIRLKRSAAEWEKRYRDKEAEYFQYKEKQRTVPEVKLQAEINMLNLEKNELERRLEQANVSTERYKQQWQKALREFQRVKQREQEQSKATLKKQQQELEHMRLRYLAAEENEVMKGDHKQLEEIKNELNRLKQTSATSGNQNDILSSDNSGFDNVMTYDDQSLDQQLAVLIQHRDDLLRTRVYTHQDTLIKELERRIQEAMKRKAEQ
ncbi:unnamed protein product, partial [Didymodactylos carnosus]